MAKQLEKLNETQTAKIPEYRDTWMEIATAATPKEFYTQEVIEDIKDAVVGFYKATKSTIARENILIADSPILAFFVAAAFKYGKQGTPAKRVAWAGNDGGKIVGIKAAEDFLNSFKNPKEIIEKSAGYIDHVYWGFPDAGFMGFISFFKNETDIDVDYSNVDYMVAVTKLTHFVILADDFAVIVKRPIVYRNDKGEAIKDGQPYLIWADDTGIIA